MTNTEKINILIVDDKPENLLSFRLSLKNPELNIITAESGNDALSLILEYDFSLVLLDVHMPEMDGFETAKLIRSIEKTKQVPIIFVTAICKENKHISKGYEIGAIDYLLKPIDVDVLKHKVNAILSLATINKAFKVPIVDDLAEEKKLEDQLRRSQKMEALGMLPVGIAHDFNNILSSIIGYTEIALFDQLPENSPAKHCLEQALLASKRAKNIVKQIQTIRDVLDT